MRSSLRPQKPDAEKAHQILELWATRQMDSHAIARIVMLHESDVCRIIQASRDVVVELYRDCAGGR